MRLDDLSTYKKIAFYKLVSRKELEGIADERAGKACRQAGKAKEGKKGWVGHVLGEDQDEDHEEEKGRDPFLLALGRSSLN